MPLFLIKKKFGDNFEFRSNFDITKCSLKQQSKCLSFPVSLPSAIISQLSWFNKDIKVDGKFMYFFKKELDFVVQLFELEGKLKNWATIKNEYDLVEFKNFQ